MKPTRFYLLAAVAAVAAAAIVIDHAREPVLPQPVAMEGSRLPAPSVRDSRPPEPDNPVREAVRTVQPTAPADSSALQPPAPVTADTKPAAPSVSPWTRAAEYFRDQNDRLLHEGDPQERGRLIQAMAPHIRMNTLETIEWALALADPAERRVALEALNRHALSGIGARIAVDQTGFPRIMETTVLSAVGATGLVEQGDYIVGIRNADGGVISFEGMDLRQVIGNLRGEAGTDVSLYMERVSGAGDRSERFEVSVRRSLLVVQPPHH